MSTLETERTLIHLSKTFTALLNKRAYSDPWFTTYVSPTIRTELEGDVKIGIDSFIHNYRAVADASPSFRCDISNASAVVHEQSGSATVIMSQTLSGYEGDLESKLKAGAILVNWRRSSGEWKIGSVYMVYGTPCFLA